MEQNNLDIKKLIIEKTMIILSTGKENITFFSPNPKYITSVSDYINNNLLTDVMDLTKQIESKTKEVETVGKATVSKGEKLAFRAMKPVFMEMLRKGSICIFTMKNRLGEDKFYLALFKKKESVNFEDAKVFENLLDINIDELLKHI